MPPALAMLTAARLASLASGRGGLPTQDELPWVAVLLALFAIAGFVLLRGVGLSRLEAGVVSFGAPALVAADAPLGHLGPSMTLAANVAGCIIPIVVGLWVLATRRFPILESLVVLGLAVGIAFFASRVVPERGVLLSYRLPALVLGIVAAALFRERPDRAGAVAFAAGGIGVLVGADLLHLRELAGSGGAGRVILGGAGLLDGILLVAILAAAIATCVATLLRFLAGASARRASAS